MTGIIAMKHFQETFHSGTTGTHVSIIYSFYTVLVLQPTSCHNLRHTVLKSNMAGGLI